MVYSPEGQNENQNHTFTKQGLKYISSCWPLRVERRDTDNGHQEDSDFSPSFSAIREVMS